MKTKETNAIVNLTSIVDINPTDNNRFLVVVSLQVDGAPRKEICVVDCDTKIMAINTANKSEIL